MFKIHGEYNKKKNLINTFLFQYCAFTAFNAFNPHTNDNRKIE